MKILILKPSSLGDVVQALPVLRLLRLHRPEREIYWWLDTRLTPLLEGDPDLAGLIPFPRRRWASPLRWWEIVASVRNLREHRFDWVIDLQSLFRSGLFAWLANGTLTIGLDDAREGARAFYDIAVKRPGYYTHAVDWYLEALRVLEVPVHQNFTWIPERPSVAQEVRARWLAADTPWVVLQPGARWVNKRWPAGHFAELVRRLATWSSELRFAVLGGADDAPLGREISQAQPGRCLDLTGKTTLPQTIEVIRAAAVMVTNDTGPMHIAAALGRPVVALFGPTEARRTGPYRQETQVLHTAHLPCVPCMKDYCAYEKPVECLRAISAERVAREVAARLNPDIEPAWSVNRPAK